MTLEKPISKSKYKTTMRIDPLKGLPLGFISVLQNIFYKKPVLAEPALKILKWIRDEQPHHSEYTQHITSQGNNRSGWDVNIVSYHSILSGLRGAGMIVKRNNYWYISNDFHDFLADSCRRTEEFMRKSV